MLGKLTRQQKAHSGLDLSGCDRGPLVVVGQSGSLGSDSLKDIVDKAVHDGHSFAGNASVWVHLLQDLVDVDSVGFPPPPLAFLVGGTGGLCLGGGLLASFRCNTFGRHDEYLSSK